MRRSTLTHIPVDQFLENKRNHPNFKLFHFLFRQLKRVVVEKKLNIIIYANRDYIAFGNNESNIISLWIKENGVFMDSRLPHHYHSSITVFNGRPNGLNYTSHMRDYDELDYFLDIFSDLLSNQ